MLFQLSAITCRQFVTAVQRLVTGQLADATGDFECLVFVLLAASARPRVVQSARCPVCELGIRELAHPRVVQLASDSISDEAGANCNRHPRASKTAVLK